MKFSKYQGTGNDFVMVDNRDLGFDLHQEISRICDRKFGVGSDGLILVQEHSDADFEMVFFNPDGSSSFCGNGSRCAVAFAFSLGMATHESTFIAIDGKHTAVVEDEISVKMSDCEPLQNIAEGMFINTGSPHFILQINDVKSLELNEIGSVWRHRTDLFGEGGTNVNVLEELNEGSIFVRTYERGVEAETLSCGTGVTAAAISYGIPKGLEVVSVETPGGSLSVSFTANGDQISNLILKGPAEHVFDGIFPS